MNFGLDLMINKIVVASNKPIEIAVSTPYNEQLLGFLGARRGKVISAVLSDVQGELILDSDEIQEAEDE